MAQGLAARDTSEGLLGVINHGRAAAAGEARAGESRDGGLTAAFWETQGGGDVGWGPFRSSAQDLLCDLEPVTFPLCAFVFPRG